MSSVAFVVDFSLWYYSRAFYGIVSVWMNLMWFVTHFFSIPLLLKTLFAPWKRMTDSSHHAGLEDLLATIVMNIMTRIFGAIIRMCIILIGLFVLVLGVVALCVVVLSWAILPLLLLYSMLYGVMIMIP